jgi:large-conductance mechanosensitive channel
LYSKILITDNLHLREVVTHIYSLPTSSVTNSPYITFVVFVTVAFVIFIVIAFVRKVKGRMAVRGRRKALAMTAVNTVRIRASRMFSNFGINNTA